MKKLKRFKHKLTFFGIFLSSTYTSLKTRISQLAELSSFSRKGENRYRHALIQEEREKFFGFVREKI